MFRGVSHISMDAKGRMALPARHREKLLADCAGQLVATIDTQSPCLLIYPLPTWETIEREIQELPSLNPAVRRFQRLLIGYASDLELDGSGRVLLPQSLREYASLEKKLVLVGQVNKMELWDEAAWFAERAKLLDEATGEGAIPEELMSISL
jgi:MraZ protein